MPRPVAPRPPLSPAREPAPATPASALGPSAPVSRSERRAFSLIPAVVSFLVLLVCLVAGLTIYANRIKIADYFSGLDYAPSEEMAELRAALGLTPDALRIFNASHPELNDKDSFNSNCESHDPSVAVFGCYRDKKIYIYNIDDADLPGILEATLAHELLHANWERLTEQKKSDLVPLLEETYNNNKSAIEDTVKNYPSDQLIDELYVRLAVQLSDLPDTLESHYSTVFSDRKKIVSFYASYIAPFNKLNAELATQKTELDHLRTEIDSKTRDYEQRSTVYSGRVATFNSCAATVGCYRSKTAFSEDRAALVAEQNSLDALYSELEDLISAYNEKVSLYNDNVLLSNTLQARTNSNAPPLETISNSN